MILRRKEGTYFGFKITHNDECHPELVFVLYISTNLATGAYRLSETVVVGFADTEPVYSGIQVSARPATVQVSASIGRKLHS